MNLMKQEEDATEFPRNQLIAWGLCTAAGIAAGDFTGISSGDIQVISQWGLDSGPNFRWQYNHAN